MARSKSSRSTCNWFMALLTLWSMVSLVVIVVWATWPPKEGMERCQAAHHALVEKMEGARVMRNKDRISIEKELQLSLDNQTRLQQELNDILERVKRTNLSVADVREEQAILRENLTSLESEVFTYKNEEARLSYEKTQLEATVFGLQVNFTSEQHQLESCSALCDAARSQQIAAESKRKACESKTKLLAKQKGNCVLEV